MNFFVLLTSQNYTKKFTHCSSNLFKIPVVVDGNFFKFLFTPIYIISPKMLILTQFKLESKYLSITFSILGLGITINFRRSEQ